MTDAQMTAIISAVVALGGGVFATLRWSVQRVVQSLDRSTDAIIANTGSNTMVIAKLEQFAEGSTAVSNELRLLTSRLDKIQGAATRKRGKSKRKRVT